MIILTEIKKKREDPRYKQPKPKTRQCDFNNIYEIMAYIINDLCNYTSCYKPLSVEEIGCKESVDRYQFTLYKRLYRYNEKVWDPKVKNKIYKITWREIHDLLYKCFEYLDEDYIAKQEYKTGKMVSLESLLRVYHKKYIEGSDFRPELFNDEVVKAVYEYFGFEKVYVSRAEMNKGCYTDNGKIPSLRYSLICDYHKLRKVWDGKSKLYLQPIYNQINDILNKEVK